ncbi:MAG TPA: dihydropteroate synthase [Ignavibacteriales bacterium]|nr:dihydropteroate synthase [Ignavibacteriales bacterium]
MKIMAILNVTPDSFSDGGKYTDINTILKTVEDMVKNNVDIVDVGGESTRPGAEPVTLEEEINRVIPVIKAIHNNFPEIDISVDTYKSKVANLAVENGAKFINDISAMTFDEEMIKVVANNDVKVVLMHILGTPKDMQNNPKYNDVINEVFNFLKVRVNFAIQNGVSEKNIIIDPGIGFGKLLEHNLLLLKNIKKLKELNLPVLIGLSRKSMFGKLLNLNVDERDIATIITETYCVLNGADYIRTHNYINAVQMRKILENL